MTDLGSDGPVDFESIMSQYTKEEQKLINHKKFQSECSKFWALLPKDEYGRVSKAIYIDFMRRIYKLLLPHYKKEEMEKEILSEWILDCRGRRDLDYNLVVILLFRVAHSWAIHIDFEEYCFFLSVVYDRVTRKMLIKTGERSPVLPNIIVRLPEEEKKIQAANENGEDDQNEDGPEWEECDEDESPRSEYEYKYGDETDTMDLKRYKKLRNASGSGLTATAHIKDPFAYQEIVEYDFGDIEEGVTIIDQLLEEEYVLPLGYPTEQYLFKLKNDVHEVVCQHTEKNKNTDDDLRDFEDPGDLKVEEKIIEQTFFLFTNNGFHKKYRFCARILDSLYNKLRYAFRECVELSLKLHADYPNVNLRSSSIVHNSETVPISEISKVGNNPCLDRRILWELLYLPKKKLHLWINQMYIVDHIDIQYAFKSKISKIENKEFLVLKEEEGVRREEDFIPAETNYKEMLLYMLNKKFEAIYLNRVNIEKKEQARLKKQHEREEKKKKSTMKNQKKVQDNSESNADMEKLLKTFKHLVSKQGIIEDNIVNKNDFIIQANQQALSIVVIGKPRSGKSRVASDLSKSLDLVHICVKTYINKVLAKVANYEPPEDLEEGQEPPKFLTELEEEIHQTLLVGKGPDDEQQVKMLSEMVQSAEAQTKGFVLDLPLHQRKETWYDTISKGDLSLKSEDISYIIELAMSDTDIKIRAGGIKFDPETGEIASKWERDERRKPKKKKRTDEDGEGEEDEEEEEPEEDPDDPDAPRKPKILDEDKVLVRVKDLKDKLEEELQNYNSVEAPAFEKLIEPLYHSQYIKFNSAGMKPEIINEALVARIKGESTLLRPIAIPLEAEGDNKSYLTSGKEEGELPRRWSMWKQTDPVALSNGRVVEGQTDFAASFNDRVFLFESEENQKEFCSEPKKFLNKSPEMPGKFRLMLAGPTGSGKQTVATELSEKYGWTIVDWNKLVSEKMQMMRERAEFLPNNPLAEDYKIGLSEDEWKTILEGNPFDAANFLPWLYEYLDLEIEKRRPPPQPEGEGELDEEALAKIEEEKKKQEELEREKEKEKEKQRKKKEKEKKKKKKEKEPNDEAEGEGEEEEEEEPLEDIPLSQLDLKVESEETLKKPFVGGFILIGFPQTAEHVDKLKAAEVGFDKIIYLNDTDEENPGAELQKRMKDDEYYDLQAQLDNSERHAGILKEHYEDQVNEISCNGTVEEVMARVYAAIDPFFTQVDNTDNVRTTDELGEDDKQLPKGEYGDFCPVTLTKDSWLFPGSEEFEAQVDERVYRLAGEGELETFKADPSKYIKEDIQRPPQPHIMIIGPRGSGVTTQIEIICEKYKIEQFLLKEQFLNKLKEKKEERKKQRLLERGFKAPEPVEDDEEGPPLDPEIEDDPEDFDKEAHEREVLREILDANSVLIIDGDWYDLPEDEVAMQYTDLIFDARRPPELIINLSVTEDKMLKRLLDNDAIEAEYQTL